MHSKVDFCCFRKVADVTIPTVTESVSEVEELSDEFYTQEICLDQSKLF